MSAVEQTKEPSMEEILASIRRIISEDDQTQKPEPEQPPQATPDAPSTPEPVAEAAPEMTPDEDPEGTEDQSSIDALFDDADFSMDDDEEGFAGFDDDPTPAAEDDGESVLELSQDDIVGDTPSADGLPPMVEPVDEDITFDDFDLPAAEAPTADSSFEAPSLNENEIAASVADTAETTLMSADTNAAVTAAFGGLANTILSNNARTLEDLVKEMLKPMLKAWMDDNLPNLVERLVREEIERVSRGGR